MPSPATEPDWNRLWLTAVSWAAQPLGQSILVPTAEAAVIARAAMEGLIQEFFTCPTEGEATGYVQKTARQLSLKAVAEQREAQKDPQLWHRAEWRQGCAMFLLSDLRPQGGKAAVAWTSVYPVLSNAGAGALRARRADADEVDDAVSDAWRSLMGEDGLGTSLMNECHVFEQVVIYFETLCERRFIDLVRKSHAAKRQRPADDSPDWLALFHQPQDLREQQWGWDDLRELAGDRISPDRWEMLACLFLTGSHTIMTLAEDSEWIKRLGGKASASKITRYRLVREALDHTLGVLRHRMLRAADE